MDSVAIVWRVMSLLSCILITGGLIAATISDHWIEHNLFPGYTKNFGLWRVCEQGKCHGIGTFLGTVGYIYLIQCLMVTTCFISFLSTLVIAVQIILLKLESFFKLKVAWFLLGGNGLILLVALSVFSMNHQTKGNWHYGLGYILGCVMFFASYAAAGLSTITYRCSNSAQRSNVIIEEARYT